MFKLGLFRRRIGFVVTRVVVTALLGACEVSGRSVPPPLPPPPPPPAGEPQPQVGDVIAFADSFAGYTSTAALLAAFTSAQTHGTVSLDTTQFPGNRVAKFHYNNDGCLGPTDADVLLERGVTGPGAPVREWLVSFQVAFQPGYMFWWSAGGCSRGVGQKAIVIFRDPNNTTGGRITLSANLESANPPVYGDLGGVLSWTITIDMEAGSTKPGFSQIIRQHLALGSKTPNAIADGAWHRVTLRFVKESGIDVGDGIAQMWVDGTLAINYNGADPANAAYLRTWTRTNNFGDPIQFPTVLNAGAPQAESQWWANVLVWHH